MHGSMDDDFLFFVMFVCFVFLNLPPSTKLSSYSAAISPHSAVISPQFCGDKPSLTKNTHPLHVDAVIFAVLADLNRRRQF